MCFELERNLEKQKGAVQSDAILCKVSDKFQTSFRYSVRQVADKLKNNVFYSVFDIT
jgi:hypothetical protein